ncbi:MAG: hypothetical protein LC689_10605, partial [Myxococcales bacterium]|nr:hypothetical protein [Myxococcales bacterium]
MYDHRIEYLPLSTLSEAPRNPKRHALEPLGVSIRRFGYVEPIILDERTQRIVAGHGRRESLLKMREAGTAAPPGVRQAENDWLVPVVRGWSSKNDAEAEAYLVASNRHVELGGWDDESLAQLLQSLNDAGDLVGTGFVETDIDRLLADLNVARKRDHAEPPVDLTLPEKPQSILGEIYRLGPHKVMCGDATNAQHVKELFRDERAAICAPDPPYLVDYDGTNHPQSAE